MLTLTYLIPDLSKFFLCFFTISIETYKLKKVQFHAMTGTICEYPRQCDSGGSKSDPRCVMMFTDMTIEKVMETQKS